MLSTSCIHAVPYFLSLLYLYFWPFLPYCDLVIWKTFEITLWFLISAVSPSFKWNRKRWQVALSKFSGSQSPPRDPAGAPVASVYQSISDELYLGQPGPDAILPADLLGRWECCSTLSGFHSQPSVICQDMACGAINLCLCVYVCVWVRVHLTLSSVSNSSWFPPALFLSISDTPRCMHGYTHTHKHPPSHTHGPQVR